MRLRDFSGADFEVISKLLGTAWHSHHGDRSYWQGSDELCEHLAQTDQGFVAEDDEGTFLGVILLASPREEDHYENLRMHWLQQRTRIGAMANALGINARADAAVLNEENDIMRDAGESYGTDGVGEIVLLIVAEAARGQGVGRQLLQCGLGWLKERGASAVRLVTDDGCDWALYEHLGMKQILARGMQSIPDIRMYVYQAPIDTVMQGL